MRLHWRIFSVFAPLIILLAFTFSNGRLLRSADIVITNRGCTTSRFILPTDREPRLSLFNRSNEPMVFAIPKMAYALTIAPHQRIDFNLPRYMVGTFEFFCLPERVHADLGGHTNPTTFVCGLEAPTIRPYALTSGTLLIEPHTRLQDEVLRSP